MNKVEEPNKEQALVFVGMKARLYFIGWICGGSELKKAGRR